MLEAAAALCWGCGRRGRGGSGQPGAQPGEERWGKVQADRGCTEAGIGGHSSSSARPVMTRTGAMGCSRLLESCLGP